MDFFDILIFTKKVGPGPSYKWSDNPYKQPYKSVNHPGFFHPEKKWSYFFAHNDERGAHLEPVFVQQYLIRRYETQT